MVTMRAAATWFDGACSEGRRVEVEHRGDTLELRWPNGELAASCPALHVSMGERWPPGHTPVQLPGLGTLWVDEPDGAAWLASLRRPGWVERTSASWPAAVAATLLLMILVIWFDRQGAGWVANQLIDPLPRRVDVLVGDRAEVYVRQQWLAPSTLPHATAERLRRRFARMAEAAAPGLPVRLELHRLRDQAGVNAFALPNGSIVLLDGLVELLDEDETMAVLAHEIGHVAHRHGLRAVARAAGLAAVAGAVLSDFSSVGASIASGLQSLHYGRDAEREADAFARRAMVAGGVPPAAWSSLWRKFAAVEAKTGIDELPAWLSTHPPSTERGVASP